MQKIHIKNLKMVIKNKTKYKMRLQEIKNQSQNEII